MRSDFAFLLKKSKRPDRCFLRTSRPPKGPSFFGRFLLELLLAVHRRHNFLFFGFDVHEGLVLKTMLLVEVVS